MNETKSPKIRSFRVKLENGYETTIHEVRYPRESVRLRVALFKRQTCLLEWCSQNDVPEAMGGGFFLRDKNRPLGELWVNGKRQVTIPFTKPWNYSRGALGVSAEGELTIAPFNMLSQRSHSHILQAGPLLVSDFKSVIVPGQDLEGISRRAAQFDSDISLGRYPRSAIGINSNFIFSVACDGRSPDEAGLTLGELAEVFCEIGASSALNLDGGSSSTIISDYKLINQPRTNDTYSDKGFPIFSAIVFDKA